MECRGRGELQGKPVTTVDGGMTDVAEAAGVCLPDPGRSRHATLTASGTISGYAKNPNATGLTA